MTPEGYVRGGHHQVRGWLQPEAATLISSLAKAQTAVGGVAEIGIHHGRLFILLNLLRREGEGEGAVAMDLFEHQELNVDSSGRGDRAIFEENLARFSPGRAVDVRSVDSTKVEPSELVEWGGGTFRLFSVDGGHTASITECDLRLATSVLSPGGLIILDDYYNVSWPGVSEGANRFLLGRPAVVPVGSAYGKTFFSDATSAPHYRSVMRDVGDRHGWVVTEQEFHGQPHTSCYAPHGRDRVVR